MRPIKGLIEPTCRSLKAPRNRPDATHSILTFGPPTYVLACAKSTLLLVPGNAGPVLNFEPGFWYNPSFLFAFACREGRSVPATMNARLALPRICETKRDDQYRKGMKTGSVVTTPCCLYPGCAEEWSTTRPADAQSEQIVARHPLHILAVTATANY